jgi:L,D-peptidoglycan transpeptidase YkuD (ErfK/YbiS/YcfS/YnhG family)
MNPFRRALTALAALLLPALLPAASPDTPWQSESTQLVVVITPDWEAPTGSLQRFERIDGHWKPLATPFPVTVGKNGSAWGIGLHEPQPDGPQKREGDGKAPAGLFALGYAFGYAPALDTKLGYVAMTDTDWCIDVNASPLYNRIVSTRDVGIDAVEGSTEPMRRDQHLDGDQVYRQGFVIKHNPLNVPEAGSCIFAHLWRAPGKPTAGCTAMDSADMDALLQWLDAGKKPVFVLLPAAEYRRVRKSWQLPELKN